jgi:hypothetical protein
MGIQLWGGSYSGEVSILRNPKTYFASRFKCSFRKWWMKKTIYIAKSKTIMRVDDRLRQFQLIRIKSIDFVVVTSGYDIQQSVQCCCPGTMQLDWRGVDVIWYSEDRIGPISCSQMNPISSSDDRSRVYRRTGERYADACVGMLLAVRLCGLFKIVEKVISQVSHLFSHGYSIMGRQLFRWGLDFEKSQDLFCVFVFVCYVYVWGGKREWSC